MPTFHYKNNLGQEEQIFPEACSRSVPHAFHCLNCKGKLITIHRDCIVTKYTPEEIKAHREKIERMKDAVSPSILHSPP